MGWDVKATVDVIGQALPDIPDLDGFTMPEWGWQLIGAAAAVFLVWWLIHPFLMRMLRMAEHILFTNWRLALLGTTGIVLSLAACWTTWDGMHNFTNEPILSAMITFGIQGILLIVAWLIGESFATGMNASGNGRTNRLAGLAVGMAVFFGATLLILAAAVYGMTKGIETETWIYGLAGAGGLLLVVTGLMKFWGNDVLIPYTQAVRVIAKNSMLWVMLLACMSMSVFFSFDSRFNAVFPQAERERVAELRATSQVTALLADINTSIQQQQAEQSEKLFASEGWQAYETELDKLTVAAQGSQGEIEKFFNQQIEDRNRANKEQQERIVSAQAGQAGLAGKKTSLTDELSRLRGEQPTLSSEYMAKKTELDNRMKEIDAKRVEAMAEDKGVEGTGKVGRGPEYRARMGELGKLQDYQKIGEQRVKDAKKRVDDAGARIQAIERELSAVDGELAKHKGEVTSAEQRIALNQAALPADSDARVDPSRILPDFERAKSEFRQIPDSAKLASLQRQCTQLYDAMASTPATKPRIDGISCDPKQASDAAAVVFALHDGNKVFAQNCQGGAKLAEMKSTDALFGFAKKCLADASLPSQATEDLRTKISFTEMTRDDKAHRFVVSWNAFNDGNRLAYLALALAIALDSLIFMSGLFGANAIRSPLSDVPNAKPRTAEQLEGIIENALLPETFDNARMTLQAMRPITNVDGYTAEVRTDRLDPHAIDRVLTVLNAGASISAVAFDEANDRYLIRAELFEFLSTAAKRAFDKSGMHADLVELEKIVGVALLPDVGPNAETVLSNLQPISEVEGLTAEVKLYEVPELERKVVRNVLNAGATLQKVRREKDDASHYFVHKDLYRTIARIRARTYTLAPGAPQIAGGSSGTRHGGSLKDTLTQIGDGSSHRLLRSSSDDREDAGDEAVRQQYVATFLDALNIEPETYIGMTPEEFAAAVAASDAFRRARQTNRKLDEVLEIRDEQARMSLDEARNYLSGQNARDGDALKKVYSEIYDSLHILMLLPNGPYQSVIDEMVAKLEPDAGEDRLSPEQAQLLTIAHKLFDAFKGNARDSKQSWLRLTVQFNNAASGTHVTSEPGNVHRLK
jgi:hypothetical protein